MAEINFKARITNINSWKIIQLPKEASKKLPSRGMVFVKGKINGSDFQTILEPDGRGGHWFELDKSLQKKTKLKVGDMAEVLVEVSKDWPEPTVPKDLENALSGHSEANLLWEKITPMARWDWLHWIGSTKNPETRQKRIDASMDKMKKGERRPCCFNRSACLIPDVSKSGVLLED